MPRKKDVPRPHTSLKFDKWNGVMDLGHKHERSKAMILFLFGRRGSGKSVAHLNLLWRNCTRFYCGVAISKVRTSLSAFEKVFPRSMVYSDANDAVMERTVAFADLFASNDDWPMDDLIINIDDGSTKNNALNSEVLKTLTLQGRHLSITVIVAAQYFKVVSPQIRNNASRILFGREPNAVTREKMWKEFFMTAFPEKDVFYAIMDRLTMNYAFLGINCDADTALATDAIFQFRGIADVPHFRIGHRDIWLNDNLKRLRGSQNSVTNIFHRLRGEEPAAPEEPEGDVVLEDEADSGGEDGGGGGIAGCGHTHGVAGEDGDNITLCTECLRQEAKGKAMTPEQVAATAVECEKRAALAARRTRREAKRKAAAAEAAAEDAALPPKFQKQLADARAARLPQRVLEAIRFHGRVHAQAMAEEEAAKGGEAAPASTMRDSKAVKMSVRFGSRAHEPTDVLTMTGFH